MVSQTTIALCLNSATVNDLKGLQRRRQLNSIKKITFVVNLGVGQAGPFVSSFGKQSGCHWSLVTLEFHNKEHPSLLFCDTLGWDCPSDLINRVIPFLSFFGCVPFQDVLMSIAHIPTPGPKHICSLLCLHYPIQTCSNVCGVISVICAVISVYDEHLFAEMTGPNPCSGAQSMSYLHDPSRYERYLRRAIMAWYVSGEVDMTYIYPATQTPSASRTNPPPRHTS